MILDGLPSKVQLTVRVSGLGFWKSYPETRDRTEQHEGTRGLLKGTLSITSSPRGGTEPKVQLPFANCHAAVAWKSVDKPVGVRVTSTSDETALWSSLKLSPASLVCPVVSLDSHKSLDYGD